MDSNVRVVRTSMKRRLRDPVTGPTQIVTSPGGRHLHVLDGSKTFCGLDPKKILGVAGSPVEGGIVAGFRQKVLCSTCRNCRSAEEF